LAAITQARMDEDGGTLNPESITVLDSACGSGHILVEAYEVLKAIYLERGYQPRAIPRLILEHNLYCLDIDDRRLLESAPQLHIHAMQESKGLVPPASLKPFSPREKGRG